MGQASKAILPRDAGGPWGKRIKVSVGGTLDWGLRVGAYVTGRVNSGDWLRYSLVVLNWYVIHPHVSLSEWRALTLTRPLARRDDHPNGPWDPTPVQTTIEFRGMQATYTFPVGVTTLWWYAPNQGHSVKNATVRFGNASASAETVTFAHDARATEGPMFEDDKQRPLFRFDREHV